MTLFGTDDVDWRLLFVDAALLERSNGDSERDSDLMAADSGERLPDTDGLRW